MSARLFIGLGVGFLIATAVGGFGQSASSEPQAMVRNGKFVMQDGQSTYLHLCQGCHMSDAKGASGAGVYPALAGDPRLASGPYAITVILKGQKAMPPFGAYLDDQQVADVVNYVRNHFGNRFPAEIKASQVRAMR